MNTRFEPQPGEWKRVLILLFLALLIVVAVATAVWTIPTSASSGEGQASAAKLAATPTLPVPTGVKPTSTLVSRPWPGGPSNLGDIAIFLVLEGAIIVLVGVCAVLVVNKLRGKP